MCSPTADRRNSPQPRVDRQAVLQRQRHRGAFGDIGKAGFLFLIEPGDGQRSRDAALLNAVEAKADLERFERPVLVHDELLPGSRRRPELASR